MRRRLHEISEELGIKLLHCDMFPYTGKYTINFNLAEETCILAAGGIAIYEPVFVYGVCGFILGRYMALRSLRQTRHPIYFFNAGGSNNPCYSDFGFGHTFNEDSEIAKLLGFSIFTPNSKDELKGLIEVTLNVNNHKLVRLGKDT